MNKYLDNSLVYSKQISAQFPTLSRIPLAKLFLCDRPLTKTSSADKDVLANYKAGFIWPFLGKVIEQVLAEQLQGFLNHVFVLDLFRADCKLAFGTETTLVA